MDKNIKRPKKAKILWLVKKNGNQTGIIGFLRDQSEGCFIIGGPTCSHYTGHGESWNSKWKNLVSAGYMDVASAKKREILLPDWKPPRIKKKDQVIIDKILKGSL